MHLAGRTRSGKSDHGIPQRVEEAAQYMQASSGSRRGYVPDVRPREDRAAPGPTPSADRNINIPQDAFSSPYGFPQQMTGAQRGYQMPPPVSPVSAGPAAKGHSSILKTFLILLVLAGLGTGGYFAYNSYAHQKTIQDKVTPYDNLFCPGVYVDGISLGGMTPEQAMNSVQSQIQQRHDAWSVRLMYNGSEVTVINSDMLGLSVDPTSVMNEAWRQGHTGDQEQRYNQMLLLEQEPYSAFTARPDGNTQVIDQVLDEIKRRIDVQPTDAVMTAFDPSLDYPFVISDESYGYQLDIQPVKEHLYQMASTLESGTIDLLPARLEPSVHKADLMKHYMLRSSVYTNIDRHSTENRTMNIQHAFDFINGYVLQPGSTFSFNRVVGERTEARGFLPAIEYVYGEHVEGFGGGVCQASTTLYQAAVCAGLQIVKREPHSDSVTYAEYGMDATVYWVGKRVIDLTFKNNTEEPIYIVAAVRPDPGNKKRQIAKVMMYGQDMGNVHYEMTSERIETLPAPFEPEYVKDTNGTYVTYKDQQQSVSKAKEGYVVNSYRLTYTGTVLTDKKLLFTDTYSPKAERIYVGVKSR